MCAAEYCACLSRGGHACSTMGGGGVSIETCCFDVTGFNKKQNKLWLNCVHDLLEERERGNFLCVYVTLLDSECTSWCFSGSHKISKNKWYIYTNQFNRMAQYTGASTNMRYQHTQYDSTYMRKSGHLIPGRTCILRNSQPTAWRP